MPLLPLIALFVVVPFVELYFIIQVADVIGAPYTVLVLIGASVIGSVLLRSQGRAAWRRFNTAMGEGRMPHTEVLDGILIVFGGAFLITPGFVTDVIGLALLLPPIRSGARRLLVRALGRRLLVGVAGARRRRPAPSGGEPFARRPPGAADVVDTTAREEGAPAAHPDGKPPQLPR